MSLLTFKEITQIRYDTKPLPRLPVISPWAEQIGCLVCNLVFPNAMVSHQHCLRLYCANHAIELMETASFNCMCGKSYGTPSNPTFIKPSPNDNWMLDNIEYRCKDCDLDFKFNEATTHPSSCPKSQRYRAPNYIHPWNDITSENRYTVSNPATCSKSEEQDRLVIVHHNGHQLASKFIRASRTVADLKHQIASLSSTTTFKDLTLYKLIHLQLDDDAKIGDIATSIGATHITSTSHMQNFKDNLLNIVIEGVGPVPRVERPRLPPPPAGAGRFDNIRDAMGWQAQGEPWAEMLEREENANREP